MLFYNESWQVLKAFDVAHSMVMTKVEGMQCKLRSKKAVKHAAIQRWCEMLWAYQRFGRNSDKDVQTRWVKPFNRPVSHASEHKPSIANHCAISKGNFMRASKKSSQEETIFAPMRSASSWWIIMGLVRLYASVPGVSKHSQCLKSSPGTTSGKWSMLHWTLWASPDLAGITCQVSSLPQRMSPWQKHSCHWFAQKTHNGFPHGPRSAFGSGSTSAASLSGLALGPTVIAFLRPLPTRGTWISGEAKGELIVWSRQEATHHQRIAPTPIAFKMSFKISKMLEPLAFWVARGIRSILWLQLAWHFCTWEWSFPSGF